MKKYIANLSKTSIMHYGKLFVRSCFFITAVVLYLTGNIEAVCENGILPAIIWLWYFVEMVCRLFPTGMESMGCEKLFAKNYHPPKVAREPKNQPAKVTFLVAMVWFALNGAIFALHFIFPYVVDKYVLGLVALAYGVCDIVCILFFCPFQTWFMKNRCCTTCRIYNWDFAMLCTPFLMIPSLYTYSLLGLALIILAKWEITYKLHPERFSERTNESLRCKNCTEKLCKHKVQLQHYIKKHKDILFERLEPVVEKLEPALVLIDEQASNVEETVAPIEEGIQETYGRVRDITVDTYEKVRDITVETYGKVRDITTEAYDKVIDKTAETISAVIDKTVDTYEWAKDFTTETYTKVKDVTIETYEKVKDKTKEILGIENPKADSEEIDTQLPENTEDHSSDIFEAVEPDAIDEVSLDREGITTDVESSSVSTNEEDTHSDDVTV